MLDKKYFSIDNDNYVTGWSDTPIEGFIESLSNEFYGVLGYLKFENGHFEIDEKKREELSHLPKTDIDILQQENEALKQRLDMSEASQLEALDMLFDIQSKLEGGD